MMTFGFGSSAGSQMPTQRVLAGSSFSGGTSCAGGNRIESPSPRPVRQRALLSSGNQLGVVDLLCLFGSAEDRGIFAASNQFRPNKKEPAKPQKFKSLIAPAFWGVGLVKVKRQEVHQNLFQRVTAKRSVSLKRLISGARILCRILN